MTISQSFIGVDVAKDWIDVFDPRTGRHDHLPTEPQSLAAFASDCTGCQVVFEASGGYEMPLVDALTEARIAFTRVNPRHAREFARATGRLAKTDRVDAALLARMGAALELEPSVMPDVKHQELAELIARKQDLTAMAVQESNRLQQARDAWIIARITQHLAALRQDIRALEARISAHLHSDPGLRQTAGRLQSAPGVGPHIAAMLIARLPELGHLKRRQIAALAGLAPQAVDSGHRSGYRRVWGGRAELRRALFIAALSASRFDPGFRAFRRNLEARGKARKVAILAVARKLLCTLNAMLRDAEDYRPKHA